VAESYTRRRNGHDGQALERVEFRSTRVWPMENALHDEVVTAFREIGNPNYGEAIRADRKSQLRYLGVGVPKLRARVKMGFSFYREPPARVLEIWDGLWRTSPFGDVLFAAAEYYLVHRKARQQPGLWPVLSAWSARVDNWAHADCLAGLYSRLLEQDFAEVYPMLQSWNESESEWLRRMSIVSLIHYSGKNAVFLPPDQVLPMVANCVADHRYYVQTAVGWVLREMGHAYPDEVTAFLEANLTAMSAAAFSRAIERRPKAERDELRSRRNDRLRKGSQKLA